MVQIRRLSHRLVPGAVLCLVKLMFVAGPRYHAKQDASASRASLHGSHACMQLGREHCF